jgi:hypothetical protein
MTFPLVQVIFGVLLLFVGRRLFWLFAAIAGFLFGIQLAGQWFADWPTWMQLIAAIALGIVMAILAVVSLRLAGMLVGFVAGWLIMTQVLIALGMDTGTAALILNLLAGIVGAVLALAFFDIAIVVLSALSGATIVAGALGQLTGMGQSNLVILLLGAVLAVVGIIFQMRDMGAERVE